MPEQEHTAWCNVCDPSRPMPLEEIVEHLREEHGLDMAEELERWPDGEPVIIDATLEPGDFTAGTG